MQGEGLVFGFLGGFGAGPWGQVLQPLNFARFDIDWDPMHQRSPHELLRRLGFTVLGFGTAATV